eukprot:CAMPEP_0181173038 /NCGR_PEP_ID=MMETSP1096-20121128/2774_1 /TAXON_ID=156174 ORGANISM="Chrysochromulina ericina, Strain CCMP281" /NCGR_SAMPLE_ID=MMETSP1096 /ASSEMBLY_ACC=CAM_ASM_000453 /LENGTH=46 /DNA_ID= /DNA_START= /DNA_END= /DNA_ORIENTATION=
MGEDCGLMERRGYTRYRSAEARVEQEAQWGRDGVAEVADEQRGGHE